MNRLKNRCAVCKDWRKNYKTDSIEERIDALMEYHICNLYPHDRRIGGYNTCNYFKKSAWCEKMLNEVR